MAGKAGGRAKMRLLGQGGLQEAGQMGVSQTPLPLPSLQVPRCWSAHPWVPAFLFTTSPL